MFRRRKLLVRVNQNIRFLILLMLGFLTVVVVSVWWIFSPPNLLRGYTWFMANQIELNEFAQTFNADPLLDSINLLVSGEVEMHMNGGETKRIDNIVNDSFDLPRLIDRTGVSHAWRIEGGKLFYLGALSKRGKTYQVGFITGDSAISSIPSCYTMVLARIHGQCQVWLQDSWAMHYEWMTIDKLN